MDTKRKVCVGLCALVLLASVLFSSAFYQAQLKTNNVITFGSIKIQLLNYMLDENQQEVEVPKEAQPLRLGDVSRIVRVKNICKEPAFLRVKIALEVETEQQTAPAAGYVSVQGTNDAWVQQGEWLYYDHALQPGQQTENLMQSLCFDIDKLTSDYAGADVNLRVEAQAVQAKHNGTSAMQAQGWPKEEGKG